MFVCLDPHSCIALASEHLRIGVGAVPNKRLPGSKRPKFGGLSFPLPYALALMCASCQPHCGDFQRDVPSECCVSGQRGEIHACQRMT